ncbi:16S rRNA (cytidine(1402)-2'-O)-methyltransferase [Candidatus Xianfuyuplasma coldseepsis]|uniref:Ribosomal RNA small subunit methyltransferase I n=1 Tax=Candidatus Xianfuyuplasma coldseepsis TaxID=2782163 RepID=A0A7L7KSJ1_9MOLU|nr:16S rRNA (cytidine(1402)-2'-O)-methyltransferase [Xianfuyuplasma coldseepsis]QMS85232.1 16S rRNA (cytidine(1402)-2'-O)-methyltransferase [Xianfuyuplasma coldseepsis]
MNRQKSFVDSKPTLFLVATPIGNMEDITFRAVKTLQEVDVIFCEDTRVSGKLLHRYEIKKPLKSYHDFNKEVGSKEILNHLQGGDNVALISDAGMPLISDPGYYVIQDVIHEGYHVVSIPGVSAVLTAISVSGLVPHPFLFYGFLDSKSTKRKQELQQLKHYPETLVFYESPHRIHKTIKDLYEVFGERKLTLARELTKKFEEVIRGTTKDMQEIDDIKGEMVLVVEGYQPSTEQPTTTILEDVQTYIKNGLSSKDAIKKVAKERNVPKNDVYMAYHQES